ncbi:MAG: glucose-phosphate thymidylyltransferase [Flavipsychrobacter sp.]|jgi:UDP-N-acetylglucosamine diphosphorylase/glucosamine-1-phosphate N-acetyltransferase|nr:glucose-phosphate thymidylyltransferase [Flavipsychrobacter sp.]
MNYILFDDSARLRLLPFTHTRPVADIRCGILTMRERWERLHGNQTGTFTEAYMQPVFPLHTSDDNIYINGAVFGTAELAKAISNLKHGQALVGRKIIIAARTNADNMDLITFSEHVDGLANVEYDGEVLALKNVWDIFSLNDRALRDDFALITNGRKSAPIPEDVTVTGKENLFIEEGAHIYAGCIINAATGPVYIAKDTEVLEGTMMRGPIAICEHGVVKMGAKLYGATTIGTGSKVGGEINNAVFFANSNKAHDGYLGNAVIGEWCNLGADTNCSNLKNNYAEVKIWDEAMNKSVNTGLTFCGLLMGDHSKCGINTMFNTGTIVGVSCNIFGGNFPEKFVRSFSWGGSEGITHYDFSRAIETANRMMGRRGKSLSHAEVEMYRHIYDHCKK